MNIDITEKQLAIFIESLSSLSFGICEACGGIGCLEKHHWYEDGEVQQWFAKHQKGYLKEHTKMICRLCNTGRGNGGLHREVIKDFARKCRYHFINEFRDADYLVRYKQGEWIWSHILPTWEIQQAFIRQSIGTEEREYIQTMKLVFDKFQEAVDKYIKDHTLPVRTQEEK